MVEGHSFGVPPNYFTQVKINRYFLQNTVTGIEMDQSGKFWISTQFGLFEYNGSQVQFFSQNNNKDLKSNRISGVFNVNKQLFIEDDQTNIYEIHGYDLILTKKKGLNLIVNTGFFEGRNSEQVYQKSNFSPTHAPSNSQVKYGEITLPDFFHYKVRHNEIIWYWDPHKRNIHHIKTTSSSRLLFKSNTLVAFKIDNQILIWKKNDDSPSFIIDIPDYLLNEINCIYPLISDKKLFVGTANYGLLETKLIGDNFYNLPNSNSQITPYTYSFCLDQTKKHLYSLTNGGLFVWKIDQKNSGELVVPGRWTGSFCKSDSVGNIWFSQNFYLIKLNSQTRKIIAQYPVPQNKFVEDVFWHNGRFYFVAEGSIYEIIGNSIHLKFKFNGINLIHKVKIYQSKLYFCTNSGFIILDANFNTKQHHLKGVSVRDVLFVDDKIYLATYGAGVQLLGGHGKLSQIESDPYNWMLASHGLRNIGNNKILIGTNKGIIEYEFSNSNKMRHFKFKFISATETLGCNEINGGVYPDDNTAQNKVAFFATDRGVVKIYDSSNLFEDTKLNYKVGTIFINEFTKIPFSNQLTLPYNYVSLKLSLDYVNYTENHSPKLVYRISELNNQWFQIAESREIIVNRLPVGIYHLELYDGSKLNIITIEIPSPYYFKWWFILLILFSVVIIVAGIFAYRYKSKIRYQQELENMVRQRTQELKNTMIELNKLADSLKAEIEFKNKLYAILMHDLKSPLLFLSQSIFLTLNGNQQNIKNLRNTLSVSAQTTHDLYHFINEFLQWLGTQFIGFTLQLKRINLATLIQDVLKVYHPVIELKGISIHSNYLNHQKVAVLTDRVLLDSIIRNLLDNAIKYNQGNWVQLNIVETEKRVKIQFISQNPLPDSIIASIGIQDQSATEILNVDSVVKMGWKIMLAFGKIIDAQFHYLKENDKFTIELSLNLAQD